jgi:transposase
MTERERIGARHDVYLGFDVGKSFHWACALMGGEAVVDRRVANARDDVRAAIGEAIGLAGDLGVLVTVDQRNNIGALVVREARAMGCDVAYLPGISEKRARDMFPGVAKDDRLDAWVIAHTSEASPQALLPVPDSRATRLVGSQRRHCVKLATQARNRLHAVLLESDPEFEAAVDLHDAWALGVLSELGGAVGIAGCPKRRYNSLCKRLRAPRDEADELRRLAERSAAGGSHPEGEDGCVSWLAEGIRRADAEAARLKAESRRILAGDECYRCLLTIPGIGHVCAEALVSLVDISLFGSHGQLASFCGLAPADSKSG